MHFSLFPPECGPPAAAQFYWNRPVKWRDEQSCLTYLEPCGEDVPQTRQQKPVRPTHWETSGSTGECQAKRYANFRAVTSPKASRCRGLWALRARAPSTYVNNWYTARGALPQA